MDKKLIDALKDIDEIDYIVLGYHIQTANMCRGIMKQFEIDDETMRKRLSLSATKFKHFKNGAFEYSIRDWAKLQAVEMEYKIEAAKDLVQSRISFPEYKHSKPKEECQQDLNEESK